MRLWQLVEDDDPHQLERLARICRVYEQLRPFEAIARADALNIYLLPRVGYAWTPQGTQVEVMTPGTNEKHYLVGTLDLATGTLPPLSGAAQNQGDGR